MTPPVQDPRTIDGQGAPIVDLPEGVSPYDCPVVLDERGSLGERFSPGAGWNAAPTTHAHPFTVRPGEVKGWGVHELPEDRSFILSRGTERVRYDDRPTPSTHPRVSRAFSTDRKRQALTIASGVHHASQHIGLVDAPLATFPTRLDDRENPDKFRLPTDNATVAHSLGAASGR